MKSGIDQDALISMFSQATAQQGEQLRHAVYEATLGALQGRELTLGNIRSVLKSVTEAATKGAAANAMPSIDMEAMLGDAVQGMDDALLKAVQANRAALQRFVSQGADAGEKHIKKALGDLEKFEDLLYDSVSKATESANAQWGAQWAPVLEKMKLSGTKSGAQAADVARQMTEQMRTAIRESRAAGLKASQALAESYAALVSGVLIGMSDALQQQRAGAAKPAAKSGRR